MANQWGRDSGFQSGRKTRRGWLAALAMMLCLVVGAAAGYAAFGFFQPQPPASSVAFVDPGIGSTELSDALAAARRDLKQARAGEAASAAQVDELKAAIARQAADLDAMTERLAAVSNQAQEPESDVGSIKALTRERDLLASENQTLKANLTTLEADRDAAGKNESADKQRLDSELARLQNEVLPQLTAERDQLQRKTLMMLADQSTLKARAKAAAEAHFVDEKRISELEARLAEAERELTASQEVLDGLKLERRASEAPDVAADNQKVQSAKTPDAAETSALDPRRPDAVARAVRIAPGLRALSEADRQRLTDDLVVGKCVTTALKSVFERIPILALRNLIRDLNSDC